MKIHPLILSLLLLSGLTSCVSGLREMSPRQQTEQLKFIPWEQRKPFGNKAHTTLRKAGEASIGQPRKAVALYLDALQQLEPHKHSSGWAHQSYQLALGSSIELIQSQNLWGKAIDTKHGSITPKLNSEALARDSMQYDSLQYAGKFSNTELSPTITNRGPGVALNAYYRWSAERAQQNPYLPKYGNNFAVSATAQWLACGELEISLFDSRSAPSLATNFTTPLALSEKKSKINLALGFLNVYRPEKGIELMGMYCDEPLDPQRIPVVLVHGLAASPYLWLQPIHDLQQHPEIRQNYQFFSYYYPTGLPLAHSAAGLKSELRKLHDTLKKQGAGRNAERMILVGHSMGGLLSSAVTRDYTGAYSELYTSNMKNTSADSLSKKAISELLRKRPLDCVSRVVFIATPHRGSNYADNWLGKITSSLIKIPASIFTVSPKHYHSDLTQLGRRLFRIDQPINGIQRLKLNNPALKYNLSKPKLPHLSYHSIIGNRGFDGPLLDSSDGVVSYRSAHLDNVVSEKIVPSWHNAHQHPQTSAELTRILLQHLRK